MARRRPLLVCPEPEFSQLVEPRNVQQDLIDSHNDKLLPSHRMEAPATEERLVVEMLPPLGGTKEARLRVDGKPASGELRGCVAEGVRSFQTRLPAGQQSTLAAVVLISSGAPRGQLNDVLTALRAAGVKRLAIKRE